MHSQSQINEKQCISFYIYSSHNESRWATNTLFLSGHFQWQNCQHSSILSPFLQHKPTEKFQHALAKRDIEWDRGPALALSEQPHTSHSAFICPGMLPSTLCILLSQEYLGMLKELIQHSLHSSFLIHYFIIF